MKKINNIINALDKMIPNPICELKYQKDYELLIATVLSAQTTDKRVNEVTKVLFKKYDIFSLADAKKEDIEKTIKSIGTFRRKSIYIIEVSRRLVKDYNGIVPNNRNYLESLPGVGRKVCNVVIANLFNEPVIAVDTHVERVSKRLGLAKETATPKEVEESLNKLFPKEKLSRLHHQLVLFGRYICKSKKPKCNECLLKENCNYLKKHLN
ncbi:MAG TPA: endonuclease III [Bacilli bacterium]|nr:endonuclease III [Bacilli bacterium]